MFNYNPAQSFLKKAVFKLILVGILIAFGFWFFNMLHDTFLGSIEILKERIPE